MRRAATAVAVLGAALAPGVASAQDDPRPVAEVPASEVPHEPEPYLAELRLPWRPVIGFDFGIGVMDLVCSGCSSRGSLHVDLFGGVQVSPRVALLAEVWSMLHLLASDENDDSGLTAHTITHAGARVWLAPRLWVQGGAGMGLFTADQGDDHVRVRGPAAAIAIGSEPGHRPCSGIDISLRVGGTRVDLGGEVGHTLLYSVGAAVGFHWN